MSKTQVILRHCDRYDPQLIQKIICEGMETLGVHPNGRTMVKPNLVMPHKRYFAGNYTRPEFLDGLLLALKERGQNITDLAVGERSGLTVPSRYAFAEAGYKEILRRHRVRAEYFDEQRSIPFALKHPDRLRSEIYVPEAIARCDFLVNAPKFKAHAWLKVTLALKNYIGLQDDAHRLIDHDFNLVRKIVDLQEVISPGFIAVDGISAGGYSEISSSVFPLHLIVMGVNPVAVDSVCAHIVGLNPEDIGYIRLAAERGIGPRDLSEIHVGGDVSLSKSQHRAKGIELMLDRADGFLNGKGNIRVHLGSPPEGGYCEGGCPGSLIQTAQILEVFQPNFYQEMRPLRFIIGAYDGELQMNPGEKAIFLGDCTSWSGQINGRFIAVDSVYQARTRNGSGQLRSKTAVRKSLDIVIKLLRQRNRPVIVVRGCPVPVLENTNIFSLLGGTINPSLQRDIFPHFIYFVLLSRIMKLFHGFFRAQEIHQPSLTD
jgi:uncharacterized protein (DUF362 family)